jgi:hypothetical protein
MQPTDESCCQKMPKIKLKFSADGKRVESTYDSDEDEEVPKEEHVILRLPDDDQALLDEFHRMVKERQEPTDMDFIWKGASEHGKPPTDDRRSSRRVSVQGTDNGCAPGRFAVHYRIAKDARQ